MGRHSREAIEVTGAGIYLSMATLTVLVPTYRRATDLRRCLLALTTQVRRANEVLVVVRPDDEASRAVVIEVSGSAVRIVDVTEPGVIAAMNAGLSAATGDIIALTDDDAAPLPDWLERIERHFAADDKIGGVGGRDDQFRGDPSVPVRDPPEARPGHLQWWGRIIGQHHAAVPGPPRDVTILKGVNCAYRREALRQIGGFDTRLAGSGAQAHWELSLGLALQRAGWRLIFDPAIGVDHFPAPRFDEDQRGGVYLAAQRNTVHNETMILASHFSPGRRLVYGLWTYLIGTSGSPGLAQAARLLLRRDPQVGKRWLATFMGRVSGFRQAVRERRRA